MTLSLVFPKIAAISTVLVVLGCVIALLVLTAGSAHAAGICPELNGLHKCYRF
jgi:hypothetical protein